MKLVFYCFILAILLLTETEQHRIRQEAKLKREGDRMGNGPDSLYVLAMWLYLKLLKIWLKQLHFLI